MKIQTLRNSRSLRISLILLLILLSGSFFVFNLRSHSTRAASFTTRYSAPYSYMGVTNNVDTVQSSSGSTYLTLAFVNANGGCSPAWPNGPVSTTAINNIRNNGGDVVLSFGGYDANELAMACGDVNSLQAQYQSLINTYGLTHLDFDIEHGPTFDALPNTAANDRRNKAITALESANPGLRISYTLGPSTSGLPAQAMDLINNAISNNTRIDVVNLMVMDYGTPIADMGAAAVSAANGTFNQLQSAYPGKSAAQVWAMIGLTPMLGTQDSASETFTYANGQTVLNFAQQHNIGELAFWSVARDNGGCPGNTTAQSSCSGLSQNNYDFTHLFNQFNGGAPPPTNTPTGPTPKPSNGDIYAISAGNTSAVAPYNADGFVSGGIIATAITNPINTSAVSNPAPQAVYQHERYGAMTYTLPNLKTGVNYTVRLHFSENYYTAAGQRLFNISLNGASVLNNFDIFASAGGRYIATVKQFTTSPNSSGQIVIGFTAGTADLPKIDGIEIIALTVPPTLTPTKPPTSTPTKGPSQTPTNTPPPTATPVSSMTVYEAESLTSTTNGPANTISNDAACRGGVCMVFQATAAGNVVTYTVSVPQARTYDVRIGVKKYSNKGIFQFASNGVNHGVPQDLYSATATFPLVDIGSVTFNTAGTKSFTFTVTGKNASSSGFTLGIDYIELIPQ